MLKNHRYQIDGPSSELHRSIKTSITSRDRLTAFLASCKDATKKHNT